MKKINIKKSGLLIVLLLALFSCSNDDTTELFDTAPAERLAQRNSELLNLLTSESQGYKATYFTKNDEFGGFTFYMKFNENGTVDMTSDFNSETEIQTSSFDVRFGTTNELIFTTRNHIQKVSDPLFDGLIATGYKGTSVFQYFNFEDGKIIFKDVRNRNTSSLVLEPTGFTNFETESVQKAEASLAQRQNILPKPTSSVFQILRIENDGGTSNFNLNYDSLRHYAKPTLTSDSGEVSELAFGMLFTETGLILSPALEFEGQTYEEFTYDVASNSYISTVNGTTATILFADWPAYISPNIFNIAQLDGGAPIFLYRPSLGANSLTSVGHDAIIDGLNDFLGGFGISVFDYIFFFDFDDNGQICEGQFRLRFNGFPDLNYCFSAATINDDRTFNVTFQGPLDQDSLDFQFLAQDLIDFFNSTNGMVGELHGGFETDSARFSNLSVSFASLDSPNLRVYGLFF